MNLYRDTQPTPHIKGYKTVLRLSVDNLFNKAYWRDIGEYRGDDYLFPGAPRTARLCAMVNFQGKLPCPTWK